MFLWWILFLCIFGLFVLVNETDIWLRWCKTGRDRLFVDSIEMVHPNKSKKAILLFHEFSGLPVSLEGLGKELYEDGWDVFIPAMPETVASLNDVNMVKHGPLYNFWYGTAERWLQQLKKKYTLVVLGGASIGGTIALDLATRYEVGGVILVASPLRLFGWHYYKPFSRNVMLFFSGCVGLFCPWWRTKPSFVPGPEKRFGVDGVIWMRAIHSQKIALRSLRGRLKRVEAPCLLIQASKDRTVHPRNIVLLMSLLTNASREAYVLDMRWDTQTRHHLLLNHEGVSSEVKGKIRDFLRRFSHV